MGRHAALTELHVYGRAERSIDPAPTAQPRQDARRTTPEPAHALPQPEAEEEGRCTPPSTPRADEPGPPWPRRGDWWRCSGADADARWPRTLSPWQCYCGAVWRLEEASDDEDKATMRRDEGERSSWLRFLAKVTLLNLSLIHI